MEKVKGSTLFKKTLLFIVILFVVIAIINSAFFSFNLYKNLTNEFISKATAVAQGLADSSIDIFVNDDAATAQSYIDKFADIKGVGYVFVAGKDRRITVHTFVGPLPPEIDVLIQNQSGELTDSVSQQDIKMTGLGEYIDVAAPILLGKMGYLHVGMDKKIIMRTIYKTIIIQNLIILALFIISIFIAYIFINRISQPLTSLTAYSNALSKHDFRLKLAGHFGVDKVADQSTDEIGMLANSFSRMEAMIMDYVDNLEKTTAERERAKSELDFARNIQLSLLPRVDPPPFPDRKEFDVYAFYQMTKEVGGDLYDFFFIDEDHLCLVIGDVSGKGVPAALFMSMTKSLLRSIAMDRHNPVEMLKRLNNFLSAENDACMFVTILCGVFDTRTGILTLANGGHNPPMLTDENGRFNYVELPPASFIGAIEDSPVSELILELKPGDIFFAYTDGVTESMNADGGFYGEERLFDSANREKDQDVKQFVIRVINDVNDFVKDAPQADDITALAIRYNGNKQE